MAVVRKLLLLALVASILGACGGGGGGGDADAEADGEAAPSIRGTVVVYAAQSLTAAFTELGAVFERDHPGTTVSFNFAGSATLVTQITQGAPADVFASADASNVDRLVEAGLVAGTPEVFARNRLEIVVGKGNPKGVRGLADLARTDVTTALCADNVPCGTYARTALTAAGVQVTPTSEETSVAGVLGRVKSGEVDAGIVYATDVPADDGVSGVEIPDAQNVLAEYPHALLKDAKNVAGARAWLALVESAAGRSVLARYGFLAP